MTAARDYSTLAAAAAVLVAGMASLAMAGRDDLAIHWFATPLSGLAWLAVVAGAVWMLLRRPSGAGPGLILLAVITLGGLTTLAAVAPGNAAGLGALGLWSFVAGLGLLAWRAMALLSAGRLENGTLQRISVLIIPAAFGLWLLYLWEITVLGFGISPVLLPAPSAIGRALLANPDILAADFYQTFAKAVLAGYAMGCGAGFFIGVLVDRVPFLQRGLLPLGNLVSALPIVGVAPIMVMWFGFDWQSKAAVVFIMTFFPMLVNTIAGLAASGAMERDLMRSYGASYGQTMIKLRLPSGMPFVFNALKINSTLALIGAIVAEFFGTPIVGMGFRISTEVGRMNLDMVWATIAVAAVAGSLFYGLVSLAERTVTFWHPSFRQ